MANNNVTGFNIGGETKKIDYNELANKPEIPTVPESLKNPKALKFTGAVEGTYDGSAETSVNIPEQVQADYSENDETSKAFVKNRPFYEEAPTEHELFNKTLIMLKDGENYTVDDSDFKIGNLNYSVTIGDNKYPNLIKRKDEETGDVTIGDASLTDETPFYYNEKGWTVKGSAIPENVKKVTITKKILETDVSKVTYQNSDTVWSDSHTYNVIPRDFNLKDYIGKELIITYNGKTVNCEVKSGADAYPSQSSYYVALLGNASLMNSSNANTGEEFVVAQYNDGHYFFYTSVNPNGLDDKSFVISWQAEGIEVLIIISAVYGNVHKIDSKFENQSDWNENDPENPAYIANRPFYEPDEKRKLLVNYNVKNASERVLYGKNGLEIKTRFITANNQTETEIPISFLKNDTFIVEINSKKVEGKFELSGSNAYSFISADQTQSVEDCGVCIMYTQSSQDSCSLYELLVSEDIVNSSDFTLLIYKKLSKTEKIDKKFLPELKFSTLKTKESQGAKNAEYNPLYSDDRYLAESFSNGVLSVYISNSNVSNSVGLPSEVGSGSCSTVEGAGANYSNKPQAGGDYSHAEGYQTKANGDYSHAEGYQTKTEGQRSHAEGENTDAKGVASHAEGYLAYANGDMSHAEGYSTTASGDNQHVSGKYNIADTSNTYAEIIGNGTSNSNRSNARTLDWSGNEWLAGSLEAVDGIILHSTTSGSSKKFKITVDDTGKLTATEVVEQVTAVM